MIYGWAFEAQKAIFWYFFSTQGGCVEGEWAPFADWGKVINLGMERDWVHMEH